MKMNEAKRDGVLFQVRYKDEIIDVYGFCSIGSGAQFIYCNKEGHFNNVLVDKCIRL